jgi:phosphate transport system protein
MSPDDSANRRGKKMTMHLQRDLDKVRKHLTILGGLVKEITGCSIKLLSSGERGLQTEVDNLELAINELEVEIEEECLKILALHQPVAIDLRFIIVVLKVTNDLERMGDQAVNISHRVKAISDQPVLNVELPIAEMGEAVIQMVVASLDCLINQDVEKAKRVVYMDDRIDHLHAKNYELLREAVIRNPHAVGTAMSYATVSSNLERVGDLCTNIAEEVMFMIDGFIVRHNGQ